MKRVVEGETLERWFGEILKPKLDRAAERGVIRRVEAESLAARMADLWAVRRPAEARVRAPRR